MNFFLTKECLNNERLENKIEMVEQVGERGKIEERGRS